MGRFGPLLFVAGAYAGPSLVQVIPMTGGPTSHVTGKLCLGLGLLWFCKDPCFSTSCRQRSMRYIHAGD